MDGLLSGMVMGGISSGISVMQGNPMFCFVAGTAVLTTQGKKAIETIQVGDTVPCIDHIADETIRTTTTHPFQIKDKGWVDAGKLQVGDLIYNKDWNTTPVEKVEIITLAEPVEVYNFEVEDCHTYYVGDDCWLVHNTSRA